MGRKGRGSLAGVLAAASLLLFAVPASAVVFRGDTSQTGQRAKVFVGSGGRIKLARITWTAECRDNGSLSDGTHFIPPFDRASKSGFLDRGGYRAHSRRYDFRYRGVIAGKRHGDVFRGRFKVKIVVKRDGAHVDTCRSGTVRWEAHRAADGHGG